MKLKYNLPILLLAALMFSSCSNVVLNYNQPSANNGTIVIKTTSRVYANITVNDSLLFSQKLIYSQALKTITITNVPEGRNIIHFSADSYNLKDAMDAKLIVNVDKGKTNTQLLTVPPRSNGYWISNSFYTLGVLFSYLLFTSNF